ncbi:MAG: Gfo/Idh/MocA family oxidoreductase [Clostridiales bacterium]|nr:Gfo/Idh/MocA family oxidoreductase [Clostridiales bacterium]
MDKVRYGVIGVGMGKAHMFGIRENTNAELVAMCDTNEERMADCLKSFPGVATYTDYRELLKRDDLDAVVVATPDQLHREMTLAALDAGKHVLCEKPMALTLDDCQAMIDASRKTDKKLMIGQIGRFTPGFKRAKELIDNGEIGDLFFVESEYAHDYSKIPGKFSNWRLDPLRHGFLGGGCHAVDLVRWIAGNPYEIAAFANKKMLTTWPTDDCTIAIMKFPNDVIGKVFVSIGCKRNYTMRSVFYGSKGTIIVDNTNPTMQVFKTESDCGFTVPMLYPIALNNHNTKGEIAAFTDVILNGTPLEMDAVQGACTVKAALAAVESSKTGQVVKVDYNF